MDLAPIVHRIAWLALSLVGVTLAHAAPGTILLRPYASGFTLPLEAVNAHDGSGRVFVVEQGGLIRIVRNGTVLPTPFLDLTHVVLAGGEMGLLGLAFHPDYAANGRFFVYYNVPSSPPDGGSQIVIAEYHRSAGNPDVADPTPTILLTIAHPMFTNHNSGKLAFRPGDPALYATVGDGGGAGNPFGAAQNLMDLRGKMLRLDVDHTPPDYSGNPFFAVAGARPEIWAYGLRNAWRYSFDRLNGDLFIGDVGQDAFEEIDYVPAGSPGGLNFGWSVFEGFHCYSPPTGCSLPGMTPPVIEYAHNAAGGNAVTGGSLYRGPFRELYGYYVYGDFVGGNMWYVQPNPGGTWTPTLFANHPNIAAFGEDEAGELYAVDLVAGALLRFAPPDADGDGMSDAFETQYFGSPTAGDPMADDDGDGLPNLQEYREGRNPLVKDNDVFTDARLFAMQQYRDFLAREGKPTGIEDWARRVSTGALSRNAVIQAFFDSPEFQSNIAPVVRLYFAAFGRVPDYPGLSSWIAQQRAGMPIQAIAEGFAGSQEFNLRFGSIGNGDFVDQLYLQVLGRPADPAGRAAWLAALDGGTLTRGQVLLGFSESAEYKLRSANRVLAASAYTRMLRRTPDAPGFASWVAVLDAGNPESTLIAGFFGSTEYRLRFLPP
jgi:glucose/arabinose dehydrogenase